MFEIFVFEKELREIIYNKDIAIIDIREKEKYDEGHIIGAYNYEYDKIIYDLEKEMFWNNIRKNKKSGVCAVSDRARNKENDRQNSINDYENDAIDKAMITSDEKDKYNIDYKINYKDNEYISLMVFYCQYGESSYEIAQKINQQINKNILDIQIKTIYGGYNYIFHCWKEYKNLLTIKEV